MGTIPIKAFSSFVLVVAWALLTLGAGNLWFGVPRDYYEYLPWYENLNLYFDYTQSRFEPGFYALAWFFRHILEAQFGLLVGAISAISLGIKFWLFKRHLHYPVLAMLCYVAIFFPIHEYTQYRAALSLSFGYLATHMLLNRRWFWAGALFLVSVSLHGSSLLLFAVSIGGYFLRGNKSALFIAIATLISATFFEQIRFAIEEIFSQINPLTAAYLENTANLENVSILSINNLLLIALCLSAIFLGYYQRTRYHMLFLTITLSSISPLILLSSSPIIAQRAKEVLFVAMIFLVFRGPFRLKDGPVLVLALAQAALLCYLAVREGVIFR